MMVYLVARLGEKVATAAATRHEMKVSLYAVTFAFLFQSESSVRLYISGKMFPFACVLARTRFFEKKRQAYSSRPDEIKTVCVCVCVLTSLEGKINPSRGES